MMKRITGLFLAVAMLLSSVAILAGCGKKSSDEWAITESDIKNAVYMDMSLTKDDKGAVTLTATSGEDIFNSNLKDSYFYIVPLVDNQTDEASAQAESGSDTGTATVLTDKELSAKALKNVTYNRADGKTLTFSFTDATENVIGYTAYMHKNALATGTYGLALGVAGISGEGAVVVSASVAETFNTATVNPTITVKLENTDTAESFTKDMVTLGNAFADLTVTGVSGQGGTILLSTSGKVIAESSLTGTVKFAGSATTYGKELYASAPVDFVTAYIDDSTFAYTAGKLTFHVCLASDTFRSNSGITIDGMTVTVDSLSEDKKAATVSVSVAGADVDAAIAALKGKDITIAANAVTGGNEYVISFNTTKVGFGTFIDFITKNDDSPSFAVEAYLFAKNGTFAALSASDISLAGDFANATDVKLEKVSDTDYSLKFNFVPAGEVNEESFSFNGNVIVASKKIVNNWGTANKETLSVSADYSNVSDRLGFMNIVATVKTAVNVVRAFADANSSVIDTVKNAGSKIGSAVGPVKSVLGFLGIIPTTDSKLDEIQSTLNDIQDTLSQIDNKVVQVGNAVATIGIAVEELNYQQQKLAAQAEWNRFVDTMTDMNGYIASFQSEYYAQLKAIVSKKNASVTIYKDEDGVTLPLNMDSESILGINGKRILSATEVKLPEGLPLTIDMLQNNGGNIGQCYDAFLAKVENEIVKYLPSGVTAEEFTDELCLMASYRAMANIGGATKVANSYIDLCANICGKKAGKTKPLDDYYTMLANTYNFASETEAQRYAARLYLSDAVINGGLIAAMASTLLGDENMQNKVDAAYAAANNEIENNTGDHPVSEGQQYCYIVGRNITGFCMSCDTEFYADPWYRNYPASYMSSAQCKILLNRYSRLKASGNTSSSEFWIYLQNNVTVNNNGQGFRLVSGQQKKTNADAGVYGSWKLNCDASYKMVGDGYPNIPSYTAGKTYQIGQNQGYNGNGDVWVERTNWTAYQIDNQGALSGDAYTAYRYAMCVYWNSVGQYTAAFSYCDSLPVLLYLEIK